MTDPRHTPDWYIANWLRKAEKYDLQAAYYRETCALGITGPYYAELYEAKARAARAEAARLTAVARTRINGVAGRPSDPTPPEDPT